MDEEATEGDRDSLTDDREAAEFPLTESKEDKEEDTEEGCRVGGSWEEVREEGGVR